VNVAGDGSRAALVLLHGALGASAQLAPLAAVLGDRFSVHRLDFEGHGERSGGGRAFRIEHFAQNVAEFLRERAIERASLFGYSMGGYVALHLAATRPALVDRVATLATKFEWTPDSAAREAEMLDPARIRAKVPRFADIVAARHAGFGWEQVLAATRDMMLALGAQPPLTSHALGGIAQPVRVMVGDRDATATVEESAAAVRALPAGELEVLPRTPHPLEKVPLGRLAASLAEFFGA
jgi:pimeloyl-ACP methyl ester carboxylesterase